MTSLIPIYDSNPTRRPALVNYLLIAINLVAFVFEPVATTWDGNPTTAVQACHQIAFFRQYSAIPKELTSNHQLPVTAGPPAGPDRCALVAPSFHKVPALSVLYAMFLHGSWLHLLGNMLFLFVFGNNVEDRLGRLRYLLFYLACGYAATYGFALAQPGSTTTLVGASGAIAGVLGAYLIMFPRAKVTSLMSFLFFLPARFPAWLVLGSWFVIQWLYSRGTAVGQGAGVAYLAHVVGFITGIVLVILLGGLRADRRSPPPGPAWGRYA